MRKVKIIGITAVLLYASVVLIGLGFKMIIYAIVGILTSVLFLLLFGVILYFLFWKKNGTNRKNTTQ